MSSEEDDVYTDVPSSDPVSDLRLKIAMFNTPIGASSGTKPILTTRPSRPPNGVGPKPPVKLPPKKQGQGTGPTSMGLPPKIEKPGPLPLKSHTSDGISPGKGGALSPVRGSVVRQADKNTPTPKPAQSPTPMQNHGPQYGTLYPPGGKKIDSKTPRSFPTSSKSAKEGLIGVDGQTYRKLPFLVPKGSAPVKPSKPPATLLSKKVDYKMVEVEEIYEDASSYRDKLNEETQNGGANDEEDYEEVGKFSETFRQQQEVTNCDNEFCDDNGAYN